MKMLKLKPRQRTKAELNRLRKMLKEFKEFEDSIMISVDCRGTSVASFMYLANKITNHKTQFKK